MGGAPFDSSPRPGVCVCACVCVRACGVRACSWCSLVPTALASLAYVRPCGTASFHIAVCRQLEVCHPEATDIRLSSSPTQRASGRRPCAWGINGPTSSCGTPPVHRYRDCFQFSASLYHCLRSPQGHRRTGTYLCFYSTTLSSFFMAVPVTGAIR
jgi:hypothetical protein